jgi:hypothetical protein
MTHIKISIGEDPWRLDAVMAGLVLDGPTPDLRGETKGNAEALVPLTEKGAWWIRCQFDPAPAEPAAGQRWVDHGVELAVSSVDDWDGERWVTLSGGRIRRWIDFVADPNVCCITPIGDKTVPAPPPTMRERIACLVEDQGERAARWTQDLLIAGAGLCLEAVRGMTRVAGAWVRGRAG